MSKKDIAFWEVGDQVDVFPDDTDEFDEFTGTIVEINTETGLLNIKDMEDDVFSVFPHQIVLTYSEETENIH